MEQQPQQLKKKVYPVELGLSSDATKKQYAWHLNTFLLWLGGVKYKGAIISAEGLLQIKAEELERLLIEYLGEHMHKQKKLSHSTISNALASVLHFCDLNDIILNRQKISKVLPADENHVESRTYTRKEIEKLLDYADVRFKAVILLMVSSGMRIGAIPDLQLLDLTPINLPIPNDPKPRKIYKIWVYNRSKKDRYYTFCTPETAQAIDDYLRFRKEQGEHIDMTSTSPLIREQFRIGDRRKAARPSKMSLGSIEKTLERTVKKAGLSTTHKVMLSHGMRKYCITQMQKARVDFNVREYLVGHKFSRGLDVNYDKTSETDRLVQWSAAINNLTINSSFHLKQKLEIIEGETNQKIARLEAENQRIIEDNQKIRQDMKILLDATKQSLH